LQAGSEDFGAHVDELVPAARPARTYSDNLTLKLTFPTFARIDVAVKLGNRVLVPAVYLRGPTVKRFSLRLVVGAGAYTPFSAGPPDVPFKVVRLVFWFAVAGD